MKKCEKRILFEKIKTYFPFFTFNSEVLLRYKNVKMVKCREIKNNVNFLIKIFKINFIQQNRNVYNIFIFH